MNLFKSFPKFLKLLVFLFFALILDLLLYGFAASCPSCSSFSQFLQTPASLSGPIIASLTALFSSVVNQVQKSKNQVDNERKNSVK